MENFQNDCCCPWTKHLFKNLYSRQLKEKVNPKSSLFCLRLQKVNIQLFHSPKFQPLKCQMKFFSKEATSEAAILKLSWQPGCVYVTSSCPTRNWQSEGEKPATDFVSFTTSAKCIFPNVYPLHYLQCYHFRVWSMFESK